ncbi:hypothetical protein CI610_00699 [invertebrate metagenome]|uniref:DNA methylase adenine-specific domain-containing protein n=1 Tax=invertebrate metagenome TaxID=1711999 RepID=A0A2H9TAQ4_9ZZZZ
MYFTPSKLWMKNVAENETIKNCKKGLDPMAGNGWLSYFFEKEYGINIKASDDYSFHTRDSDSDSDKKTSAI